MIFIISGYLMYLIEGATKQNHQDKIGPLRETSDPEMFFINSTISPLHTNTAPQTPEANISFGPHCHTSATNTDYPVFPVDQFIQQRLKPAVTGCQVLADNTTDNNPLLAQNSCEIYKLLPLLCKLTLKDDTLISLKFYDEITLNLTKSTKKSRTILPDFHHIGTLKTFFTLWYLMWDKYSTAKPVKLTSSCPNFTPRT